MQKSLTEVQFNRVNEHSLSIECHYHRSPLDNMQRNNLRKILRESRNLENLSFETPLQFSSPINVTNVVGLLPFSPAHIFKIQDFLEIPDAPDIIMSKQCFETYSDTLKTFQLNQIGRLLLDNEVIINSNLYHNRDKAYLDIEDIYLYIMSNQGVLFIHNKTAWHDTLISDMSVFGKFNQPMIGLINSLLLAAIQLLHNQESEIGYLNSLVPDDELEDWLVLVDDIS